MIIQHKFITFICFGFSLSLFGCSSDKSENSNKSGAAALAQRTCDLRADLDCSDYKEETCQREEERELKQLLEAAKDEDACLSALERLVDCIEDNSTQCRDLDSDRVLGELCRSESQRAASACSGEEEASPQSPHQQLAQRSCDLQEELQCPNFNQSQCLESEAAALQGASNSCLAAVEQLTSCTEESATSCADLNSEEFFFNVCTEEMQLYAEHCVTP